MRFGFLLCFSLLSAFAASCGKHNKGTSVCADTSANAVGRRVYYRGKQGGDSRFDINDHYVGKVLTVFQNGTVEIEWLSDTQKTVENINDLRAETTCTPDLKGKKVLYRGTQGGDSRFFPSSDKDYVGKATSSYTGNYIEVDWDHLEYNTVENLGDLRTSE